MNERRCPDDYCEMCDRTPTVLVQDITDHYDPHLFCELHDPSNQADRAAALLEQFHSALTNGFEADDEHWDQVSDQVDEWFATREPEPKREHAPECSFRGDDAPCKCPTVREPEQKPKSACCGAEIRIVNLWTDAQEYRCQSCSNLVEIGQSGGKTE